MDGVRFWAFVDRSGPLTACWLWKGGRNGRTGYGCVMMEYAYRTQRAHRVAWELYYRRRIPVGLQVDHLCRVRLCCNPLHLEVVTQAENMRRAREWAA